MTADQLRWYVNRAGRMSPGETASRVRDHLRRRAWRTRQVHPGQTPTPIATNTPLSFPTTLDASAAAFVTPAARAALLAAADELLTGRWYVLGATRHDLADPDWFHDPSTGRRAPNDRYAFRIRYRSEAETGNVKQIWEVSRHQHLTVLAAAYFLSDDSRYADAVATQLRSWWRENPFLSGVHWTSGIEIGLRLIAWTWIRRLLGGWDGARDLFENNELAVRQIHWHQQYLAAFRSSGSSANNHVIAEAAAQLVASCAMPWFAESARWRDDAVELLRRETAANTFASGVNRELASDYHLFVAELLFLAAVECEGAGVPLGDATWAALRGMTDAAAAMIDATARAPRQGDSDEGRALLLDGPDVNRWSGVLALGVRAFGPLPWWPAPSPTVLSALVGALAPNLPAPNSLVPNSSAPNSSAPDACDQIPRPERRPAYFSDAGIALLRTTAKPETPELWCRADGGPHGFLSTAAHAHADALSVEIRHGGVDVLADPGTYCYHGEAEWRSYFRSTVAHNTIELGARDQSRSGGPFMWVRHAPARVVEVIEAEGGEIESWTAQHDGYAGLDPPATHRRTVRLDRAARRFDIIDEIETDGVHAVRLAFHLGPAVEAVAAAGNTVALRWLAEAGPASATLRLPDALRWEMHRGEVDPILGWYSPTFGVKQPTTALVGVGTSARSARRLESALVFHD